jgi:hypothetical protein
MNKKTQVQAVREVFQFGIGVIFLVSVFYFLYNFLIPGIEDYALSLQLTNIAEHVNYLISKFYTSSTQSLNSVIESKYLMPEKIGEYSYSIFFLNNKICSSIKDLNIEKCSSLIVDSTYQGYFYSGGELKININYNESNSMINIGN